MLRPRFARPLMPLSKIHKLLLSCTRSRQCLIYMARVSSCFCVAGNRSCVIGAGAHHCACAQLGGAGAGPCAAGAHGASPGALPVGACADAPGGWLCQSTSLCALLCLAATFGTRTTRCSNRKHGRMSIQLFNVRMLKCRQRRSISMQKHRRLHQCSHSCWHLRRSCIRCQRCLWIR